VDRWPGGAARFERTYYVHGHRVQQRRLGQAGTLWICDCPEYLRSEVRGLEPSCMHAQRVAAALSIDRLAGSHELTLRAAGC